MIELRDVKTLSDDNLIAIIRHKKAFEKDIRTKAEEVWLNRYFNNEEGKKESIVKYEELQTEIKTKLESNVTQFEVEEYLINEGVKKGIAQKMITNVDAIAKLELESGGSSMWIYLIISFFIILAKCALR